LGKGNGIQEIKGVGRGGGRDGIRERGKRKREKKEREKTPPVFSNTPELIFLEISLE
jgi:hypothetical protein